MAKRAFRELTTAFLREKMAGIERRHGGDSPGFQALARQYVRTNEEDAPTEEANLRHYDAEVAGDEDGHQLPGIERLYKHTLVIEPTLACLAHCRFCIRANYPRLNLSEPQLREIAVFCGSGRNRHELTEVLLTGGDVLTVPHRVDTLLRALIEHAPNIRIARIATRLPLHDPAKVDDNLLRIFEGKPSLRLELATQINHRVELFPEVIEAYQKIMDRGVRVYAQNVLLRGVNDDVDALADLYEALRLLGIEAHYLFHCVPLKGMGHLRTTLQQALDLTKSLTCSGRISGRVKPMLATMTDIGKIILYDGVILARDQRRVLLQSNYRLEDRRRWNPRWRLPDNAEVDRNGLLRVWYLDGPETPEPADAAPLYSEEPAWESAGLPETAEPTDANVRLPVLHPCG